MQAITTNAQLPSSKSRRRRREAEFRPAKPCVRLLPRHVDDVEDDDGDPSWALRPEIMEWLAANARSYDTGGWRLESERWNLHDANPRDGEVWLTFEGAFIAALFEATWCGTGTAQDLPPYRVELADRHLQDFD